MKDRRWFGSLMAAAALLCVLSSPARSSGAPVGGSGSSATIMQSLAPPPSGLVVVLDTNDLRAPGWRRALNNPSIAGVALQIRWSDIEAEQGAPDWSQLDEVFAAVTSAKKWVHLLIFPGFFSPAWALQGAKTEEFPIQYGPGKGAVEQLPMPWDPVYLDNWLAFVKLVAARYGDSTALRVVAASGPTSVSAEFTLPESPHDLRLWQNDGYTPSKYEAAWQTVFKAFADDFEHQYISVSEGTGLNINDQGRLEADEHVLTRQAIVDEGSKVVGSRFVLQSSDVHAGAGPRAPDSSVEDQFVIGYIGRTITGFQLRTSAENASDVMGADGDPPLALNRSINLALAPNGAGKHVDYIEVYEPDVLAAATQAVLRYGASAFVPQQGPFVPRVLP